MKLLQNSYQGKVKVIYLDPPYNTGRDFIYRDNFKRTKADYIENSDDYDDEGNALIQNTESNGRFHSDWLSMMYPRLKLARNLLRDDGVIFISIDDNEQANLKRLCDEIFGEANFIENFSWTKTSTPPSLSNKSRKTNEYILCYEKARNDISYNAGDVEGGDQPLLNAGNSVRELCFPVGSVEFNNVFSDGDYEPREAERVKIITEFSVKNNKNSTPVRLEGEFKWTQDFLNKELDKGTYFIIKSDKMAIRFIRGDIRQKRPNNYIRDSIITPLVNKETAYIGTNESAAKEVSSLLGGHYFDYPKPVSLIKYLTNFTTQNDDIILDFFAGSGTTAQAVMELNAQDGGNRRFILVQLPEKTAEKSEVYKAGYKNIAEISKERIRRAGAAIKTGKYADGRAVKDWQAPKNADLDTGFRVLKLASSNMKPVYYLPQETRQEELPNLTDNIKAGRTGADLLFALLLEWGLPLDARIEAESLSGRQVYYVNKALSEEELTEAIACFDDELDESFIKQLAEFKPLRAVFRDSGFNTDSLRENAAACFKQLSPQTNITVI